MSVSTSRDAFCGLDLFTVELITICTLRLRRERGPCGRELKCPHFGLESIPLNGVDGD